MEDMDVYNNLVLAAGVATKDLKRAKGVYCFGSCLETVILETLVSGKKSDEAVVGDLRSRGERLREAWYSGSSSAVLVEAYVDGRLAYRLLPGEMA